MLPFKLLVLHLHKQCQPLQELSGRCIGWLGNCSYNRRFSGTTAICGPHDILYTPLEIISIKFFTSCSQVS